MTRGARHLLGCFAVCLMVSPSSLFAYTKPVTYRPAKLTCTNYNDPSTCTVIPDAIIFKEQYPLSPHSWAIPKAIDLIRADGYVTEADLAQKYLLPMLEGVTFNDVWGDADIAGASVLDYYIPDKPDQNFVFGCVLNNFFFAPYKNCTNTRTPALVGFDTHPFYGYGNAAEHAQFRYD